VNRCGVCGGGDTESFRESENQNKELTRSVQELTAVRMQLQSDRDAMDAEIQDSRDTIKDLQSRLDSATSVMNQLKVDLDSRVRERDEEIENLRSVAHVLLFLLVVCVLCPSLYRFVLKAKFRYASWFGAGSEPVRSRFGAEIWPII